MAEAENRVERYLHKRFTDLGGTTYKWSSPGRVGVPDRICILRGEVWFVEVKTEIGKLSVRQAREIERLKGLGCNARAIYDKRGVDIFMKVFE